MKKLLMTAIFILIAFFVSAQVHVTNVQHYKVVDSITVWNKNLAIATLVTDLEMDNLWMLTAGVAGTNSLSSTSDKVLIGANASYIWEQLILQGLSPWVRDTTLKKVYLNVITDEVIIGGTAPIDYLTVYGDTYIEGFLTVTSNIKFQDIYLAKQGSNNLVLSTRDYTTMTGGSNTIIGYDAFAGSSNDAANGLVLLGTTAGYNATGSYSVVIGSGAGGYTGNSNVYIGASVASAIGSTGTGNIIIGTNAGATFTGSSTLIMDNTDDGANSFFYGNLATDKFNLNAGLTIRDVSTAPKAYFLVVDEANTLVYKMDTTGWGGGAGGGTGYWTRNVAGFVYPATLTDQVGIGGSHTPSADLDVDGDVEINGYLDIIGSGSSRIITNTSMMIDPGNATVDISKASVMNYLYVRNNLISGSYSLLSGNELLISENSLLKVNIGLNSGAEDDYINTGKDFGVGTGTPDRTLDVVGTARVSDTLTLNGVARIETDHWLKKILILDNDNDEVLWIRPQDFWDSLVINSHTPWIRDSVNYYVYVKEHAVDDVIIGAREQPSATLDVHGTFITTGTATIGGALYLETVAETDGPYFLGYDPVSNLVTMMDTTGWKTLWREDVGNGYLYPATLTHKVGIGINDPAEMLEVYGDILLSEGDKRAFYVEQSTNSGLDGYDLTVHAGASQTTRVKGGDLYLRGGYGGGTSGAPQGGNVYLYGANGDIEGNTYLAWSGSTKVGRVGVGHTNPQTMLDIDGAIKLASTTTTQDGTVRWNGLHYQGWKSSIPGWVNLDEAGGGSALTLLNQGVYKVITSTATTDVMTGNDGLLYVDGVNLTVAGEVITNESFDLPTTTSATVGVIRINDEVVFSKRAYKNTFIGVDVAESYTTGSGGEHVMIGDNLFQSLSGSTWGNLAIGVNIGDYITGNNACGDNLFIGMYIANDPTHTDNIRYNIGIGTDVYTDAGQGDGWQDNIAIGSGAMKNPRGSRNITLGYAAARLKAAGPNTDNDNIIIGSWAGEEHEGEYCIYIGERAGYMNLGNANIGIGRYAAGQLYSNGADDNIAIGNFALYGQFDLTADNIAVGNFAGEDVTTAINNILIGTHAGDEITTGDYNIIIGDFVASTASVNPSNELWIGQGAADTLIWGDFSANHVIIGGDFTVTDQIFVKDMSAKGAETDVVYYNQTTNELTYGAGGAGGGLWTQGTNSAYLTTTTDDVLAGGATDNGNYVLQANGSAYIANNLYLAQTTLSAGAIYIGTKRILHVGLVASTQSVFIGEGAGNLTTGAGTVDVAIGYDALSSMTSASQIVAIGSYAFDDLQTGSNSVAIGSSAAGSITTTTQSVFIGAGAGDYADGGGVHIGYQAGSGSSGTHLTGQNNITIGNGAGKNISTGVANVCIGNSSGTYILDGTYNTFVGWNAGNSGGSTVDSDENTGVGASSLAGINGNAKGNTAIGYLALNDVSTGNYNVGIGRGALQTITTVSNNVAIGYMAGYGVSGATNVLIGNQAGYSAGAISNILMIENSTNITDPLLYGNFSTDVFTVNGVYYQSVFADISQATEPHVNKDNVFTWQSLTANRVVTDLWVPVVNATYTFINNDPTYTITFNDSGNFNLTGTFVMGTDDVLVLFVRADNDYLEVSRSNN